MSYSDSWRASQPTSDLDRPRPRKPVIPPWLRAWWPAFAWAGLITAFSTDTFSSAHTSVIVEPFVRWLFPTISRAGLEIVHHVVRKCAHFVEYFVFCMLLYHGIRATRRNNQPWHWHWFWALIAWLVAAAFSLIDEFHQTLVPSRGPSLWDSALDSTGALFAILVLFLLYRVRSRRSS